MGLSIRENSQGGDLLDKDDEKGDCETVGDDGAAGLMWVYGRYGLEDDPAESSGNGTSPLLKTRPVRPSRGRR